MYRALGKIFLTGRTDKQKKGGKRGPPSPHLQAGVLQEDARELTTDKQRKQQKALTRPGSPTLYVHVQAGVLHGCSHLRAGVH